MDEIIEELTLSDSDELEDLESIKIPYVLKDKILMSPGVWNNYYYSSDAIKDAFSRTEWDSKEVRSLFLDHQDRLSREWIGEIRNQKMNGEDVVGDLVIVDKPTAMKLAYGAKMGISPKVHGGSEANSMHNFMFDNFSVVINPAVKTAWINNMQLESIGDTIEVLSSFVETEDLSNELSEYTNFVKKFIKSHPDLEIQEAIKKAAQEWKKGKGGKKMSEEIPQELAKKPEEEIKKEEIAKKKEEEALAKKKEEELAKKEKLPEEVKCNELSDIKTMFEQIMSEIQELKKKYPYPEKEMEEKKKKEEEMAKKPEEDIKKEEMKKKEEYPYPYKKMEENVQEMSQKIVTLTDELKLVSNKLNEPNKVSVKQELSSRDIDMDMFDVFRNIN